MPARICSTCRIGFMLSSNLNFGVCEGCLGANHANQALAADDTCLVCRKLSLEEKQRRVDFFAGQDEGFDLLDPVPLDQLINFEPESDDPASEVKVEGGGPVHPFQMVTAGLGPPRGGGAQGSGSSLLRFHPIAIHWGSC